MTEYTYLLSDTELLALAAAERNHSGYLTDLEHRLVEVGLLRKFNTMVYLTRAGKRHLTEARSSARGRRLRL